MNIKETILPLADAYALEKWADAMHDRQIKGATNKARAALCAALDAADREVERLTALQYRPALCHKFCEVNALTIEIRGLKAENVALRSALQGLMNYGTSVNADVVKNRFDAARAALGEKP